MRGSKKVVIEPHRHEGNKFFFMYDRRSVHGKRCFSTKPSSKTLP